MDIFRRLGDFLDAVDEAGGGAAADAGARSPGRAAEARKEAQRARSTSADRSCASDAAGETCDETSLRGVVAGLATPCRGQANLPFRLQLVPGRAERGSCRLAAAPQQAQLADARLVKTPRQEMLLPASSTSAAGAAFLTRRRQEATDVVSQRVQRTSASRGSRSRPSSLPPARASAARSPAVFSLSAPSFASQRAALELVPIPLTARSREHRGGVPFSTNIVRADDEEDEEVTIACLKLADCLKAGGVPFAKGRYAPVDLERCERDGYAAAAASSEDVAGTLALGSRHAERSEEACCWEWPLTKVEQRLVILMSARH
eukprot:TRINITY_DN70925_c0_g1_i1.p1 TRINITY_DN70925_c0_g1~~TRINITY_DN70925_c0_g1_i1.p1  ORF type:complete len:340 (-),score=58.07 TRINITY_DN70925_c0_g1_i1:367-1320(-)